jgi:ABC-type transporter Mla maintaining outer membrane lipid asymmetry permease subunit MlaE
MSDARERWKENHRARRVRARWVNPLRRRASTVLLVAAVGFVVLAIAVHLAWLTGFVVALLGGLMLRDVSLGEIFSAGGFDGYVDGGGDGGDSGS